MSYGQKGVDGGSQWRTGTREAEVRLNGWCEGGGGGCVNARKIGKSGEPKYICS